MLTAVADVLRSTFRETDLIARLGGDEFCVVASGEPDADPAVLERRLDEAIAAAGAALGLELSLSHGTVVTDWRGLEDPDEVLTRADMLMYEAKRTRRDARRWPRRRTARRVPRARREAPVSAPARPGPRRQAPQIGGEEDAHDQSPEGGEPRGPAAGEQTT